MARTRREDSLNAPEVEASLIGALQVRPEGLAEAQERLTGPEAFSDQRAATAYEVIQKLIIDLGMFDSIDGAVSSVPSSMVLQGFRDRGLNQDTDLKWLVQTVERAGNPAAILYMAKVIEDKYIRRLARDAMNESLDNLMTEAELHDAVSPLTALLIKGNGNGSVSNIKSVSEEVQQWVDGGIPHVSTDYPQLDYYVPLAETNFALVGGRPSIGKSALVGNIALNVAWRGEGVAIFSREMSKAQLYVRLACQACGLSVHEVMSGKMTDAQREKFSQARKDVDNLPLFIDDDRRHPVSNLVTKMRSMCGAYDIHLFVVDYIQLVRHDEPMKIKRYQEIGEVARALKDVARDTGVPVLCAAQLNRAPKQRASKRPDMNDLRESGDLEQDSDVIVLMHSEDYCHRNDPEWTPNGKMELLVEKNRNGPTGVVTLQFYNESMIFRDDATPEIGPPDIY